MNKNAGVKSRTYSCMSVKLSSKTVWFEVENWDSNSIDRKLELSSKEYNHYFIALMGLSSQYRKVTKINICIHVTKYKTSRNIECPHENKM